jgi:hypothetical protein
VRRRSGNIAELCHSTAPDDLVLDIALEDRVGLAGNITRKGHHPCFLDGRRDGHDTNFLAVYAVVQNYHKYSVEKSCCRRT